MRLRAALAALLLALPLAAVGSGAAHAAESPLTASFAGVPSAHDGVSPFSFDLVFSEPASVGYKTLRDDAFSVIGGSVTRARRVDGRSDRWQITVAPDVPTVTDAVADVSIELAATSDCDDTGAVCTADDAKALSNTTSATVAAPPPLTAAFESVPETHDSSAEFSFRLRFSTAVTTSYRILGGTAFDVAGGEVGDARRIEGRSDLWQITIQPDAVGDDTVDDDITITLPTTEDCTDTDAVCTVALRPLSEPVTASVEGPLVEAVQSIERGQRVTRGVPGDKDEEEDRVGVRAPDVVLVSNIGLDSDDDGRTVQTSEAAKGFTTGSHAHDYNLTSVELDVLRPPTSIENLVVQIWSSTTVSGNTVPVASLITLTNPASLTQGANTFAAPEDSVLDAGTSYFVFVSSESSPQSLGLYTVTSGNETAADTTGLTGWAILEARIRNRGSNDSWVANTGANFQFRLNGSEAAAGVVPAAPTGVTAAAENKSLLVGWSAVTATPAVTGYKIRYRPAGSSDAWTEWTGTIAADATSETVTGLTEWVSYDVQVRAVNRTGDGAWSDTATGTAHRDVTLSAAGSVDGLASDGTTLWTTVPGSNIASAYTLSDGTADTTKNITFATDTAPTGICAHGTRVWVAQSNSTTLQAYDNTDDTRQSAKDVTLPTGTNPVAVFCNDSYLFVAHDDTSGNDDAVLSYKDDLDGSYDRIMDKDVEGLEAAGNANPAGLSIDGDILWVSDSVDNKAYAYSTTTGRRLADMDLDLRSAVGTAAGIWGDTATLWAADADATATEIDSSRRPLADAGDPDVWHATMENGSSTKMRVEFSEVLDGTSPPPTSAFTVMAGTDTVAVDSVVHRNTGDGPILKTLVLTLDPGVPAGTTVTVSYTKPAANPVQDLDGNDAPNFSGLRVWSLPGGLPGGVSVVPGDGELEVSWDAAADTGRRPAGTSYQVQHKLSTATEWTTLNRSGDDNPEVSPVPDVVLVSNIGLDSDDDGRTVQTSEAAKGFTTGSHGDGYNLTSVELDVLRPPTSIENLVVQIWSSTTVSGNTVPDDSVITLTNPALLTQGANTFAAPEDSVLDAGTSYFVFVSSESSPQSLGLYTVTSGNETAADTTGLTGWAILEARIRDRGSSDSWVANTGANFQFRLNGSEAAFVVGQTIAGLTNGSQHDVRVRAENNVGDGPYSAVASATPSAGPLVEVDAGSADNTFKATDNKSDSTTWHYAWIAGTAVCDSTTTFPDMSNYNEGDDLTYTSTQNTNKACFRSTEGTNSGYAASDVVNTNVASSDATLSALTLVEGSTSVTLSPSFASGTTEYRAWVANGVSSVTVTATKNDDGASVAITDDSDTSTPGTAVLSLEEGANTITVTVTAADTTTTGTYTITAVREASAPTADPTALLTAKMTAGQPGTVGAYGYQSVGANYGALNGDEFDFDGTTYTITNLYWNGPQGQNVLLLDNLYLCFDSLPDDSDFDKWTLRVGSDDYRLADRLPVGTTRCVRWARTAAWAYGEVVTVKMFGNQEATGAPVVSGTAQVGQTLTASTSEIADLDGKINADNGVSDFAYEYQWIRVDGSDETDISGATSGTYVPVAADVGKRVKVEVSFTDDRGNDEELTSAVYPATGTIVVADSRPVAPVGVTVGAGNKSLVVGWDAMSDVTGFAIRYRETETSTWMTRTGTIAGTATSATVTSLSEWVSYDVQVRATNDAGDSDWSGIETGTPNRDFDLEDQSSGLWSDGTTIWAAQEGVLSGGGGYRADAYVLETGVRNSGVDFSPSGLGSGASLDGLCSNGETWWVVSGSTAKAYTVSNGDPDMDKDVSLSSPRGLWCSSDQLLAVNRLSDELHAYSLPDGDRDQHSDVTGLAAAGNVAPAGVWTDGDTVWVSDADDDKVYAYGLADSRRRRGLDIDGLGARGNNGPYGIWSGGSTMWVVDRWDDKVYSYRLPQPADGGPEAWSAAMSADGATAIVVFDEPLDTTVTPDRDRFLVRVGSESATAPASVTHTSGDNKSITLTLPSTADEAEAVTVAYTDLNAGDDTTRIVQDADGVDLATFTGLSATPRAVTAPGAPTGLSATAGDGSLTVSWSRAATGGAPDAYGVRHRETADPDMDGSYTTVTRSNAAATSEVISGLANGTGYTVQVNAVNTAGTSVWVSVTGTPASDIVDITPPTVTVGAGTAVNSFRATDSESANTWHYAWIDGSAACDSLATFTASYSVGTNVTYTAARNGQKLCFRSVDSSNNAGYGASTVVNIDQAAPTVTVSAGTTANSFRASDGESGNTWHYAWIAGSAACDSSAKFSASYTAGANVGYSSARNGQKLCFRSVDAADNAGYGASGVVDIVIDPGADQTGVCNRALQDSGGCDLSTATTLTAGVPLEAAVAESNDVDWFRVELDVGTVYRIDMEGAPTNKGTLRDPYLRGMYAVFAGSDVDNHQTNGSLDGDDEDIETIWYSLHGDCAAGERSSSTDCELFDEGTYYNDDGGVGYNAGSVISSV